MRILSSKRIPVILDTDIGMDIDDTWALGFLLKCPEFDVKLITTATDDTKIKAKLVAKFLENAGRTDIPIGIGPSENNKKGNLYRWIKDYELSEYTGTVHENGMEVLCSTIMDSHDPITLIAIGPLGTVAGSLKMNPNITENARFVGMHGSIRIGYKGVPTPYHEYNVRHDIQSAREVFQAPWEKTITPLDTCGNIVLSGENFERIMNCDNTIVKLIKENFEIWAKKNSLTELITQDKKTSILFDTVAIYLGFSEELLNIEELKIEVSDEGMTIISENGSSMRCATSWKDVQAFKDLLVNRLTI
ncbi:MAG: nucleoside hydrolase [Candidatus Thorarchaeota archaeon]